MANEQTIDMDQIYGWLKDCLAFFDIPWGQKHLMKVSFQENQITAIYDGKTISWNLDGRQAGAS
jgi:hypothetical protein